MNDPKILGRKINNIFLQVYSVNESISITEKKQLIAGFEDGINEFWGWAGKVTNFIRKAADKTKETFNSLVDKGKEYYERGKELAGEAWTAIQKFGKNVLDSIERGFNRAVELVITGYNNFVQAIKDTYTAAAEMITKAYIEMKAKAEAFVEYFKGLFNDLLARAAKLIEDTRKKMEQNKKDLSNWLEKNKKDLEMQIETTASKGYLFMQELIENCEIILERGFKLAQDIGKIVLFICISPILIIIEVVKSIPGVYDSAITMLKEYIRKENELFMKNHNAGYDEDGNLIQTESFRYLMTFERFKY